MSWQCVSHSSASGASSTSANRIVASTKKKNSLRRRSSLKGLLGKFALFHLPRHLSKHPRGFGIHVVAFGVAGEAAGLDVGEEGLQGADCGFGQVGVGAHEFGAVLVEVEPEYVVQDQHLAIAVLARAAADGAHVTRLGHLA